MGRHFGRGSVSPCNCSRIQTLRFGLLVQGRLDKFGAVSGTRGTGQRETRMDIGFFLLFGFLSQQQYTGAPTFTGGPGGAAGGKPPATPPRTLPRWLPELSDP
jgi:hypothetical protein